MSMSDSARLQFSRRLRFAMKESDIWRPTDLARKAGLSPVTVASYLRGFRGASLEKCVRMSKVLNCNPWWLFGESDQQDPIPPQPKEENKGAVGPLGDMPLPELLSLISYLNEIAAKKAA